jgi:uncharacterized protein (DUF433 family)
LSQFIGNGIYSFGEAAQLAGVSCRRVRAWFQGERGKASRLIQGDYPTSDGLVSFHDLIDALVVGRMRCEGLTLQYIRKVHAELVKVFDIKRPFCWKYLLTDGNRVFLHVAYELGEEYLKELLSKQHAFPQILLPVLRRIEYDPVSHLANRLDVHEGVIVDPTRQRGKPIVASAGIPTAILAAAYDANKQDAQIVAEWYGITPKEVNLAVAFEASLRSAA